MNKAPKTCLVTGASSGSGEAAARRLACEPGTELILVARREEGLRSGYANVQRHMELSFGA